MTVISATVTSLLPALRGGFRLRLGRFVFGLLLQAERLELIGTLAILRDDLLFDSQNGVVEVPFDGGGVRS